MAKSYEAGGFGGLVKGFLVSAVSAGVADAIGTHFQGVAAANAAKAGAVLGTDVSPFLTAGQFISKAAAHGVTQGAISAAGGGRFGDGFLGAAAGSLAEGIPLPDGPAGVVSAAIIGGTASAIGGGKFANGAISAAFVNAYNQQGQGHRETRIGSKAEVEAANNYWSSLLGVGVPHSYDSLTGICTTSVASCTEARVDSEKLRNPAPGVYYNEPVQNYDRSQVPGLGTVYHQVHGRVLINRTIYGEHLLHPGSVTRTTLTINGVVYIHTVGTGSGMLPGANEVFGQAAFKALDYKIAARVMFGGK